MKVLVTGGSGFIGKKFIAKYRDKFDIVAPTRQQMDLTDARVIDAAFSQNHIDAVVHLAGSGEADTVSTIQTDNLIMFKNIQYMSIVHGVKKLIIVGEGVEFDRNRPIVDFTEEMFGKSIPSDGYGMGRYLINLLASKDKITTSLRLFNVYGKSGGKLPINRIVAAAAKGKKIVIERDRTVSAIAVDDVVRVIAKFLTGDYPKGDYNLVADDKISYSDIAKIAKRFAKKDGINVEIKIKNPQPDFEYTAKNEKLMNVCPMRIISTSTGVKQLYEDLKPKRKGFIELDDND